MSATPPSISAFLADDKQYSSDVEKYTEGEKMSKKDLDKAQAAYDECKSELDSHTETIKYKLRARKPTEYKRTMGELAQLMTNERRAKNELTHAQLRYDLILNAKTTLVARENALRLHKQQRDTGAGVMSMPRVDPASPNLEVSRGTMAMAVAVPASAQREPFPEPTKGCWKGWCKGKDESKKRDGDGSPSSKNAGGRKYKSKRFKTKRTYKKRRTSRK
jgi:hypothetical protein